MAGSASKARCAQRGVAGTKDQKAGISTSNLSRKRRLNVDLSQHAEAFVGQSLSDPPFCRGHILVHAGADRVVVR